MSMSDSCGGSTPFKGLVDHQDRDHSLHQSRFSGTAQRGDTFRSLVRHSLRDDSFSSFVHGQQNLLMIPQSHMDLPAPPQPLYFAQESVSQSFASSLHAATSPPHAPMTTSPMAASPHVHSVSESLPSLPGQAPLVSGPSNQIPLAYNPVHYSSPQVSMQLPSTQTSFQMDMNRWMAVHGSHVAPTAQNQSVDGDFSDLHAYMDELAAELAAEDSKAQERLEAEGREQGMTQTDLSMQIPDIEPTISTQLTHSSLADKGMEKTASKTQEHSGERAPQPTHSEVSEVARQILQTVEHEEGEKWKNSTFLALMRDFRDGKKDVVSDQIQEAQPVHV